MKHLKLIFFLSFSFILNKKLISQDNVEKWEYFKDFNVNQKKIIKEHWTQFFEKDIYNILDNDTMNVLPIRFDSYGSLYPHENILKGVNSNPMNLSVKNNIAFSLYSIFYESKNRDAIKHNLEKIKTKINTNKYNFYLKILNDSTNWTKEKNINKRIDKFYKLWDSLHLAEKINEINTKLKDNKYKNVMFYIHGYNVPYSLANVQLISLKKKMKNEKITTDSILFIPIFWPSNNEKNLNINNISDFDISNKKNLENGLAYLYYNNRAYYAAITFRKILNEMSSINQKQFIFTHSLGAIVATSALINTVEKLDISDNNKRLIGNDYIISKNNKFMFDPITLDIIEGFKNPIPSQEINIFMSAPAIPGELTFCDIDTSKNSNFKNKHFYSTINLSDEMLNKEVSNLPFVNKFTMNASSLGCDYIDAKRSKNLIENINKNNDGCSFEFSEVSTQSDHDIFTYLNQKEYISFIKDFYKGNTLNPTSNKIKTKFINEYLILENSSSPYLANGNLKRFKDIRNISQLNKTRKDINTIGKDLMKLIYETEKPTFYHSEISPNTRELIQYMKDPYLIVLVERAIKEEITIKDDLFKQKILKVLSEQQKILLKKTLPYYSYENQKNDKIKFISLRVGNDLFALTTKNRDRDYTGSLLFEIATDYFNTKRTRPLLTYQTIFYGFDVFTPAFYDTAKFKSDDSYDTLDRPHGSFQYIGWSKKGLSKYHKYRWQITGKLGIIGSKIGDKFQTTLHQDVSYSLRPRGWGAQIANGGRLGWSLETIHEWQFYQSKRRTDRFGNLNISGFIEPKIGTYMTNFSFGFEFSNKSFKVCNHNFISHRVTHKVKRKIFDKIGWSTSIKRTYVFHNTMLEGYGIFKSTEHKKDTFTPKSVYFLRDNQINKWLWTYNNRLTFTTTYFTIFYNWFIFSPETKLGKLKSKDDRANGLNLSKRWHQLAEIGVTFNLNRY